VAKNSHSVIEVLFKYIQHVRLVVMKIGVLSDTHIQSIDEAQCLSARLMAGPFADVAAVLHAGDVVIPQLEEYLYPLPWYSVRGNMDQTLVTVPISRIVELAGKRLGMIHGWGAAEGIEQRVLTSFAGHRLDVLIFGHSHQPLCRKVGSVLLFNPGSATDRRRAKHHTVGILTINNHVSGEIIPID
jgi:putative phosphoesterase